jgi:hypothetical protein
MKAPFVQWYAALRGVVFCAQHVLGQLSARPDASSVRELGDAYSVV